jgi:hypothetical protein
MFIHFLFHICFIFLHKLSNLIPFLLLLHGIHVRWYCYICQYTFFSFFFFLFWIFISVICFCRFCCVEMRLIQVVVTFIPSEDKLAHLDFILISALRHKVS